MDFRRFEQHLEFVELSPGKVISEPGEVVTHVYFPTEGIVSDLVSLEGGTALEVAIIGNEGMTGSSLLLEGLGAAGPLRRSVVELAGHAYSLRADLLIAEFEHAGKLRHWLLRYTQALITQIAQIAVCARHHKLDAQLSRWLLQRLDRLASGELYVTFEAMARLLGVSREAVIDAVGHLQAAGLIRYGGGHVVVIDRGGLERRACECLGVIQREYARLLGV